jgi:hypothetical protein
MKQNEVLIHLIYQTGYVGKPFYLATREKLAKELRDEGFTPDDDGVQKFTDKGKQILNDFYFNNKERIITILRKLDTVFSYSEICNELEFDEDNRAHYLLVRLEQDAVLKISLSTNWNDRVKVTFN